MLDPEEREPVFLCPLPEQHKAQNVADFLTRQSIDAEVLLEEDAAEPLAIVAVPPSSAEVAMEHVARFTADYDRLIERLAEGDLERSTEAEWGRKHLMLIPMLALLWGAFTIWNSVEAQYDGPWRVGTSIEWVDLALGVAAGVGGGIGLAKLSSRATGSP